MKDIFQFIRLSRPQNVIISIVAFTCGCYISLNKSFSFSSDPQFWYSLICIAGITATGYWINDVFDFKIDRINKPDRLIVNSILSQKKVLSVYFVVVGVILVFSWLFLEDKVLSLINLIAAALLYVYTTYFKRVSVVGNLLIATLTSLVIFFSAVLYNSINWPLVWTMIFAFEITFIREVVKDVEDIQGDLKYQLKTLPIQIGLEGTKRMLGVAYLVFILTCWMPLAVEYLRLGTLNWIYLVISVVFVQVPSAFLARELGRYSEPIQFRLQSQILKVVILAGIVSVSFLL